MIEVTQFREVDEIVEKCHNMSDKKIRRSTSLPGARHRDGEASSGAEHERRENEA